MVELSQLAETPIPELVLLFAGFMAVFIGAYGDRDDTTHWDEIIRAMAFIVGLVLIFLSIVYALDKDFNFSTLLVMGLLGFGLFMRVFRRVKWSAGIALIVGIVVFALVHNFAVANDVEWLSITAVLIITLVAMFIVYMTLHVLEAMTDFLGAIVSFRPLLLILGLLGIVEAVLIFAETSLSGLLG